MIIPEKGKRVNERFRLILSEYWREKIGNCLKINKAHFKKYEIYKGLNIVLFNKKKFD